MIDKPHRLELTTSVLPFASAQVIWAPAVISVPNPTFASVPCAACSCTGIYVEYAGPDYASVPVACEKCGGKGWHA
jgi:hypothetical protein